jgi:threonine aldolase
VPETVDLRSDTVTQPTAEMREAIATAVVGDDQYGEDPTVAELERVFAATVGKAAAVFVPSGVMANQIAARILAQPGDLIVVGAHQHVGSFEMGASARNSGVQFAWVDDTRGVLDVADVADVIDAEVDHQPHVAAVAIENSHMYSGGRIWTSGEIATLAAAIGDRPLYLDGARLFNAVVASGESAAAIAAPATVVMGSLSKGLCAPVGSLIAGPESFMAQARVERKRLGGAMRQAGFLAAAGLVALTLVDRLAIDHTRARRVAEAVARRFPESEYDPTTCVTNIVAFDHPDARRICATLESDGVLAATIGPRRARMVTHANLTDDLIDRACDALSSLTL